MIGHIFRKAGAKVSDAAGFQSNHGHLTNQNIDSTQYVVKIDHVVSNNNHLSGRYFYNRDNFQRPFNAPTGF